MSGFVSIPIHILKTVDDKEDEKHKIDNIKAIMGKYIETSQPNVDLIQNIGNMPRRRTIPITVKTEEPTFNSKKEYQHVRDEDELNIPIYKPKQIPEFQQTCAKPPSGSQTLPTPRKHYHSQGERMRRRQSREHNTAIQLPFGGGKEFENIEAELQVTKGKLSAQIGQLTGNKCVSVENKAGRSQSVESEAKKAIHRTGLKRERSLQDIDKDIEIIWREIKEFDDSKPKKEDKESKSQSIYEWAQQNPKFKQSKQVTDYEDIPLPPPPIPPKMHHRSSSLAVSKNNKRQDTETPPSTPKRSTSLSRSNSSPAGRATPSIKPCIKTSRSNSFTRDSRSRSNTPSCNRVCFQDTEPSAKVLNKELDMDKSNADTSKEFKISKKSNCKEEDNMFEWVDFKKYEGLPKGIILPKDFLNEETHNAEIISDEEDYFSAEEEAIEVKTSIYFKDASTQTDLINDGAGCRLM